MRIESKEINKQKATSPADPASASIRVRDTWLGQLYKNHLKKYRTVKLLAPYIWRKMYSFYQLSWISWRALKLPLHPHSAYSAKWGKTMLSKPETVITPLPDTFPESCRKFLMPPQTEYGFPEICITEVHNALVTGCTNLVMTDNLVICHDLYDFSSDYTSEELHGRTYIWPHRQRIAWLMRITPSIKFHQAACFTDACAQNYAHWLTEVLPRINLLCSTEKYRDVPLIVDGGLHQNLMESLTAVASKGQKIVVLPFGACAEVEHLLLTSCTGYVPFDRRHPKNKKHSHGRFSPFALEFLRQNLKKTLQGASNPLVRRIFIRRNSSIRNIVNAQEIEEVLIALGFLVIDPGQLTFSRQVAIFSNADIVVGATGAAMANLIFCKPTAKIIIMISDYRYISYWYWQNMACAVGNKVTYVFGKCVSSNAPLYHSDFTIGVSDLLDAIGTMSNPCINLH